ncbi:MAG: sensor histidine kinase [Propionibacteriaceae bacterium]
MAASDSVAWWRRVSWRARLVALLAVLLIAGIAVAIAAALAAIHNAAEDQTQQRALAIAQSVALDPRFAEWVVDSEPDPASPIQQAAEQVRVRTGALYIVVTDRDGVRYSHTTPERIGQRVSTDASGPLSGREVTGMERGTLGQSARGKVPLYDATGQIVGSVSVGVAMSDVYEAEQGLSRLLLGAGALALVAGIIALTLFWRRLRASTHGLDPEQMADLLREHAAILGGAMDGIIATDAQGRVRVVNDAATRYIGRSIAIGTLATESGLPATLGALLPQSSERKHRHAHTPSVGEIESKRVVAQGRVLDVRRVPVHWDGRNLGAAIVLRDTSDLDELGRELEATRALTDALRAQAHEHANRLHSLNGLLQLGQVEEATTYLGELTTAGAWRGSVSDPYLAGLLGGKAALASESGVEFRVTDATWVDSQLAHPLDSVTVVGNLVDNAIRAAAIGARRPAWVELSLVVDGADLLVHIVDSGDGVKAGQEESIFDGGWTTKPDAADHGIGLPLAQLTARRLGGNITLVQAIGEDHGAVFSARLADVFV